MIRAFLLALVFGLLVQQEPPPPCDNAERPWMCGAVEHYCSRDGETFGPQDDAKHRHACECKHACDPNGPQAAETNGRRWDAQCSTRCSPKNCKCPNPCET